MFFYATEQAIIFYQWKWNKPVAAILAEFLNPSRGGLLRYEESAGGALSAQPGLRTLGAHLRPVSLGEGLNVRSIGTPRHTKSFKSLPNVVFGTQVFKNQ